MRRGMWIYLLAATTALGCENLAQWRDHPKPPQATVCTPAPLPAVTPAQVNDENASQVAAALLDEMDRDAQAPVVTAPPQRAVSDPAKK